MNRYGISRINIQNLFTRKNLHIFQGMGDHYVNKSLPTYLFNTGIIFNDRCSCHLASKNTFFHHNRFEPAARRVYPCTQTGRTSPYYNKVRFNLLLIDFGYKNRLLFHFVQ